MKIPILIVGDDSLEAACLRKAIIQEADKTKGIEISVEAVRMPAVFKETSPDISGVRIVIVDVSVPNGITYAKYVRECDDEMIILVIADMSVSPMEYMNSVIRAESLLIRPWNDFVLQRVIHDVLELACQRLQNSDGLQSYLLENSDGKTWIPYRDIYYFEARNKRIYVRTKNREYGTYGTLEKMKLLLPDSFIQCHRSYIVNKHNISSIIFSQNTIFMHNRIMVPLSRTYKSELREIVDEARLR